jgi:outer membrane lipoprotein-sorting protein
MTMVDGISRYNPQVIGNENFDGKDCLVVEYVAGVNNDITIKAWLRKEKRFLLRQDLMSFQGTISTEFRNIDFSDIPDGMFELP